MTRTEVKVGRAQLPIFFVNTTANDFIESQLEFVDDITGIHVPFILNYAQKMALVKYESKKSEILFTKKRNQGISVLSIAYASYLASKQLKTLIVFPSYSIKKSIDRLIDDEFNFYIKTTSDTTALNAARGFTFECIIFDEFYYIKGFEYLRDSLRPHTSKLIMYTTELPDTPEGM